MVGSEIGRLPPQFGDASKVKFLSFPFCRSPKFRDIYSFDKAKLSPLSKAIKIK